MKIVKIKRNKYAESRFFYNNSYLLILVSKLPVMRDWGKVKVLAS